MPKPAWACALCHLTPPDVARSRKKRDLCDLCEPGLAARGLAWCSRCKRRKAQAEMTARRQWCKACEVARATPEQREQKRAYARAHYWANRDRYLAQRREPEAQARRVEYNRHWRNAHRERVRETIRASYHRHRAARIAYNREWQARNREYLRAYRARRKLAILHSWRRAA